MWNTSCVRWLSPLSWTGGASPLVAAGPSWCRPGHGGLGDISGAGEKRTAGAGASPPGPTGGRGDCTPRPLRGSTQSTVPAPSTGPGSGCPVRSRCRRVLPSRVSEEPGRTWQRSGAGFESRPAPEVPSQPCGRVQTRVARHPQGLEGVSSARSSGARLCAEVAFAPGLGGAAGRALATGLGVTARKADRRQAV